MLRNYLMTLRQQLIKFKSTYSINIIGLAFGLACCLICILHIRYEYSYDTFHRQGKTLFRLVTGDPSTSDSWVKMAPPISPKLKSELPEVEGFVRFNSVSYNEKVMVEYHNETYLEPYFMMADQPFFEYFDFPLVSGNKEQVLSDINNVAISASIAAKLFPQENPIGKSIRLKDNQLDFVVSGVFKDLPNNTHLRCDYMVSFDNLERIFGKGSSESWGQYNYFAYLKLHPAADPSLVQEKIQAVTVRLPNENEISFEAFHLQPIADIHFQANRGNLLPSYNKQYIFIFTTLAISVIVICFMNYFNAAAMLSLKRVKEIGVRKSVGAANGQLVFQFFMEGMIFSLTSLGGAVLIIELTKPLLSSWLGNPINLTYTDPYLIVLVFSMVLLLTVVSSSYLTFNVSRLKPGTILKGAVNRGGQGTTIQQSLLFVQFFVSIVLLISSVIIVGQMRFIQNKDLGFDKSQVISVVLPRDLSTATVSGLKSELTQSALVEDVALSDFIPGRPNWNQTVWWEGQAEPESMNIITVDKDFIRTLKIQLLEGAEAELQSVTTTQYIINEAAMNHIGWNKGKGKFLSPFGEQNKKEVLAVVKNFNFRSLHNEIAPLVLVIYPERKFSKLLVRTNPGNTRDAVEEIERIYKGVAPGNPFEFSFLDETINSLYQAEVRMENIVVVLTIISISFALLGIYTLISFAIENRAKEVAIRKALGISMRQLLSLFTASYFRIVLLASAIAAPLCWKMMHAWLANFNNRIEPGITAFVVVILVMLGLVAIVGLTKYLSLKKLNPATLLKND